MTIRPTAATLDALITGLVRGDRLAMSQVVTELERAGPLMPAIVSALKDRLGRALVVGFTGPPGGGKSTLVNAYVAALRQKGQTVGIIAVDPSSPISGGAILGDRIRMTSTIGDDAVFMRSLASGGHLGGLSPAAVRVIDGFDGAGKDVIVLETVGTGQNEIDVAEIADVRVVLSAPGLGDGIQAMKSGLLEIADVLVVNKADRPGAEQTMQELKSALSLRTTDPKPEVLKTCAVDGTGVASLTTEIARLGAIAHARLPASERRRRRARFLLARAAADLVSTSIRNAPSADMAQVLDDILDGRRTPERAARDYLASAVVSR